MAKPQKTQEAPVTPVAPAEEQTKKPEAPAGSMRPKPSNWPVLKTNKRTTHNGNVIESF